MDTMAIEFLEAGRYVQHSSETLNAWLARRGIRSTPGDEAIWPLNELFGAVCDLLQSAARGEQPPAQAIDLVNAASAGAPLAPQLHWPPDHAPRVWETTASSSEQYVQGLIARSAIELTTLAGADRLRMCAAWPCERLFVTQNARRRWCSETCGSRKRVARHAAKQKARDSDTGRPGSAPGAGAGPP
jgi:predicted RNA-binding Zn ribbon-like protein